MALNVEKSCSTVKEVFSIIERVGGDVGNLRKMQLDLSEHGLRKHFW